MQWPEQMQITKQSQVQRESRRCIQEERMCGEEVLALTGGHRGRSQRLFAGTLEVRCLSSILKSQCLLRVTAGTCCLGLSTPHSLSSEEGNKTGVGFTALVNTFRPAAPSRLNGGQIRTFQRSGPASSLAGAWCIGVTASTGWQWRRVSRGWWPSASWNGPEKGDGEQEMRNRAHGELSWKEMAHF